jgi:hypothetical protein
MNASDTKYRLLTRSDMDGLVCAVLLKEMGILGEIVFHHPKDVQDGKVAVTERDILTNLPYVPGCGLCFDHHASEGVRNSGQPTPNYVLKPDAKSAARVVYDYYGGKARFPRVSDAMMDAVDKADSAGFSRQDVLNPKGWELLSFLMDARTGLGPFPRVPGFQLPVDDDAHRLLPRPQHRGDPGPPRRERTRRAVLRPARTLPCPARARGRGAREPGGARPAQRSTIYAGNRFVVYAMYPQCDISMHVMWGREKLNTVYTVGKSIFDRGNKVMVGELMLSHGGGGHHAAGTCQGSNDTAEAMKRGLIQQIVSLSRDEVAMA